MLHKTTLNTTLTMFASLVLLVSCGNPVVSSTSHLPTVPTTPTAHVTKTVEAVVVSPVDTFVDSSVSSDTSVFVAERPERTAAPHADFRVADFRVKYSASVTASKAFGTAFSTAHTAPNVATVPDVVDAEVADMLSEQDLPQPIPVFRSEIGGEPAAGHTRFCGPIAWWNWWLAWCW